MPHEVIMPALGMAQDTGHIVAWHKGPGDKVTAGDVLFEVETDKATMEVEAAGDGYLTNVKAREGDDVPVGKTIALISETADGADDAPANEAAGKEDSASAPGPGPLPSGREVIMPALGMSQDTGRVVAWAKAPGDAVSAGDVLFEVETDKATMEVEADHDGYLAAVLAQEGEDAPVGGVIAVISAEKPVDPVSRSVSQAAPAAQTDPEAVPNEEPTEIRPKSDAGRTPDPRPSAAPGGRVLASPKARRLAAEKGLDLARLAEAGHPQPYHAADIDTLVALPSAAVQSGRSAAKTIHRIEARVSGKGFRKFLDFLTESGDPATRSDALAALATGALRNATGAVDIRLRVERPGAAAETIENADLGRACALDDDAGPALVLRDLTNSRLTAIDAGPAEAPVLTAARRGSKTQLTLDFSPDQLDADTAAQLADGFAARLDNPLRQLF